MSYHLSVHDVEIVVF